MSLHVNLKHMNDYLAQIDELHDNGELTKAQYIQIGVTLKITQILLEIQQKMNVNK